MATNKSFGNMTNQKPVTKKPAKEQKQCGDFSPWNKMGK